MVAQWVEAHSAAAAPSEPMCTEAQARYIIRLVGMGRAAEGGYVSSVPTTWEQALRLTRRQASAVIDSLRGEY